MPPVDDIAIVPAPRELIRDDGHWKTNDPVRDVVRSVVENLDPEEYRIDVTPDGARLSGGSDQALRHAEQTFRQLVDRSEGEVPAVRIADAPAYRWRGLMLDVVRHFMPKEFVLRLIDALEVHRMNVLHLHLTDDQGWRIQIDAYPKLTEVGAWRPRTMVGKMSHGQTDFEYDDQRHGGFYTKDDLREIVAYANDRGITVVPEIDLPGHMQAAIAAYPELGNHPDQQLGVREVWGISEDILNVSDATVEFVRNVLREVVEVFPGPYLHLGGDECPTVQWQESEAAQERMRGLGLTDPARLQGWFTAQVLDGIDRRLVAWDEILETDCPPDAVVMAWRNHQRGVAAARAGHDTVIAPTDAFYFDYYQADPESEPLAIGGHVPLRKVYDFEVMPEGLSPDEQRHVIGAQCQIWTEYMATPEHVGYMLFPRMCAFAERAWGSPRTSYDDFLTRLRPHLTRLQNLALTHRPLS